MKNNIAVVCGGYSEEAQISMKSADNIIDHLSAEQYNIYKVIITKEQWEVYRGDSKGQLDRADFTATFDHDLISFDLVFMAIHGTPGEDGVLQGYFDLLRIPYTTPSQSMSALTFNKWCTNTMFKQIGVKSAKAILINRPTDLQLQTVTKELGYPCFVKPNDGGSSFGVSKVKEEGALKKAVEEAFRHGNQVIIEEFLQGREVSCGIFRDEDAVRVIGITEIISDNEFFDFNAKYLGESKEITPAQIPENDAQQIRDITTLVYETLNLQGIARVDFIIQDDIPYMIEVNSVPGMSKASIIPQQAEAVGISMSVLLKKVIDQTLNNLPISKRKNT